MLHSLPLPLVTKKLKFTSGRPQVDADTKTAWDAATSSILWQSTDKIKVGFTFKGDWWAKTAAYASTNESPNDHKKFYQSSETTIDSESSNIATFKLSTEFEVPASSGEFVFYSVYPAALVGSNVDTAPTATVTLKTSQEPAVGSFDASTDIMVGTSAAITSTGLPSDAIELNWKRVVAHAALTFTNMAFVGTETPNKITLTFNEAAKVAGSFSVNITDGTIGAGSANEIILEGSGLTVNNTSINAWATVLPVSFSSLNVEIKTDKATYTREIASFTGGAKTFKGNARNTLTINMATASRTASAQYEWVKTDLSAITASDVFVIVGNNGDNYAMSNDKGTSSAPEAVAVTVANDKLTVAPADRLQWTLTKDGNNYTFYPNGTTTTWLYCINNNNGLKVGDTADNNAFIIEDNYLYNNGQSRYIGIYNSQDWRSYTSINNNIKDQTFAFYVKTAAGPAVTWNLESITITTKPTKTDYTPGESFDPAGMVVTGHFVDADDNTNTKDEEVTGYTISPDGALAVTDTKVTITYQGKTATQNISVSYDFETVAELNALVTTTSANYSGYLTDAVVSFAPADNTAIVTDGTGSVMFYKATNAGGHGLLQGQTFTGAITVTACKYKTTSGNVDYPLYSEVTAWDATFSGTETTVNPESITLADLAGNYSDYQNAYVSVAGLTVVSASTSNKKTTINVTDGSNNYVVYDNTGSTTCGADDIITAIGTVTKYKDTEQIKVWKSGDITITGTSPKAITISQPTGAAANAGCSIKVKVDGSEITSGTTVASGKTVTLEATEGTDYTFEGWTVTGAEVANASALTTTFEMGSAAVNVSASFTSTNNTSLTTTITYEQFTNTSYNTTASTFSLDGITFGYLNAMRNGANGTPSGWAKNQVIQTKSGGYIYNTTSMGSISNIRVYIVANTNSFTVTSGDSSQPTTNSVTRPSTATGTESITYSSYSNKTVTEGQSTTATYYDFAINNQPYFRIAPGGSLYIYKIEITYTPSN